MPTMKSGFFHKVALVLLLVSVCQADDTASPFVKVRGTHFVRDGKDYAFMGANLWYGMNLGSSGPGGDRPRLMRELDRLQKLGVTDLRVWGLTEGTDTSLKSVVPALQKTAGDFDPKLLRGLDFLLAEMKKRKMTATVVLGNHWDWSGGVSQYRRWASGTSAPKDPKDPGLFYSDAKATQLYQNAIKKIVSRKNSITGVPYVSDPTIMSWELGNEPRALTHAEDFSRWIKETSRFIKAQDHNHLVTVGSEGTLIADPWAGIDLERDNKSRDVDYTTGHVWVPLVPAWWDPKNPAKTYSSVAAKMREIIDIDVQAAQKLGKPLVFEEFGFDRDLHATDPKSSVEYRNRYYRDFFEEMDRLAKNGTPVAGMDFWSWSGEGRPRSVDWKPGDPFLGDPPQDLQGTWSIFSSDTETTKIIAAYAAKFPAAHASGLMVKKIQELQAQIKAPGSSTPDPAEGKSTARQKSLPTVDTTPDTHSPERTSGSAP